MTTTTNNEQKKLNVPNLRFKEFQGEWITYKIKDVLSIGNGRDYKHLNNGGIPVFGTGGYMTSVDECLYDGETTFIGRKGSINKPFYYNGKFWTVDTLFYTHSFNGITPKFTYCLFQTINWLKYNEASGVPSLSKDTIEKIKINIPGLEEQNKIAKLMFALDERITTQNKIIDKLQSLIKGINQSIFMNNNVINYKLGEVCGIRSGYSGNQLLSKKGLKVSRIETISGHKVNMERVGYVAPFESSENYRLRVGDILFSNINSVEYIGNTAFIDKDYDLYHGMNLLRLTPNNMVVIPFYLYLLLNTNRMLNRFKTICNKAVSQASINQTELGKTVVQIPDINAQEQICKFYQALYDKLESEKYANSLFQKQKQYLLRQMFI